MMGRPGVASAKVDDVDRSPLIESDPLDPRLSLAAVVHLVDSHEVRRRFMKAVQFPTDDMSMFLIVNQLTYRGALRPSDLASILGTGRSNLAKIAHRLDETGLTIRVPAPGDDRSVLLALTPAGREIGHRILDYAQVFFESMVADWSEDDITTLKRLLARLGRQAMWELGLIAPPASADRARRGGQ